MFKRLIVLGLTLTTVIAAITAQTTWGKIDYKGEPWVKNTSRPYPIEHGLEGRHLSLWASHGRYFENNEGKWRWQRPPLFGTTEDLFTQTIVVPYLIPMLENAGANVFTPRERDWQRNEVIVDNDNLTSLVNYREHSFRYAWKTAPEQGFAYHGGIYHDKENPFLAGTARMAETTRRDSKQSTVTYQPNIPEDGRYAVYVSYQTLENSIDDAHYTVFHQGQETEFNVNQQMGGSTWVYLGTFDFDKGCNERNKVVVSNLSKHKGIVTTDAVRFGGGMGNIERGGKTSNMPRCLEGARYYAQWAGMPYEIYSCRNGENDYADDLNVRSLMMNQLCGGSVFAPNATGRKVPIELSLAVHSDAGHTDTGEGIYGSLSICTTHYGDSCLAAGISRNASREFASLLLNDVATDLKYNYGEWTQRQVRDRNYSETRLPVVPSTILETMSHQNFGDMRYGQDPNFRFTLARAIYKSLLRYVSERHNKKAIVQPLQPNRFHIEFTKKRGEVILSWQGVIDGQEPTSAPNGFVLQMALDNDGFDNGTLLRGTSCRIKLSPNVLYRFRVTAVNEGGQSFPSEELAALYNPKAKNTVMIVNGFNRLSSPAISKEGQGFKLGEDIGVTYGRTAGWLGLQRNFDVKRIGTEGETGLGYTTTELEGMFIAGNDFNYVTTHANAIRSAGMYNIVSSSSLAIENGDCDLGKYQIIDLILGLEKNDGHSLVQYKSIPKSMQDHLKAYTICGGNLLVSGAYLGSDMNNAEDKAFLANVLKTRFEGTNNDVSEKARGLGTNFTFYRQLNETHYAASHCDILMPTETTAFPTMVYNNETCAAVAYQGKDYRSFAMGFPFECITDKQMQGAIMRGILKFLINK